MLARRASLRRRFVGLGLGLVGIGAALGLPSAPHAQTNKHDREALGDARHYKILYAGKSGGFREKAYADFLRGWFDRVDIADLSKLKPDDADPYDVLVCDWGSRYGNDGYKKDIGGSGTRLGEGFTKPAILIGEVAGEVAPHSLLDGL